MTLGVPPVWIRKRRRSFGWQSACVVDAASHPPAQLTPGFDAGGVDANPSTDFTTGHHHWVDMGPRHEFRGLLRRYPHQNSALLADGDRHVAVDQERKAAEHRLLFHPAYRAQQLSDAVDEVDVVSHG